jgi:hypothetical protein
MHAEKKTEVMNDNLLQTNFIFNGQIANIKTSKNHNFGIVYFNVDKSSGDDFYKPVSNGKFPYRTKDGWGEVYTIIPDGIIVGDSVKLVSNRKTVYYLNKTGIKKTKEFIFIITNPSDINFVNKNSHLE